MVKSTWQDGKNQILCTTFEKFLFFQKKKNSWIAGSNPLCTHFQRNVNPRDTAMRQAASEQLKSSGGDLWTQSAQTMLFPKLRVYFCRLP